MLAKKKEKKEAEEEKKSAIDDYLSSAVVKKMQKDYGSAFAVPLGDIDDKERGILKTYPSLDIALSGGFSRGQVIQIAGKPKTGKTTLAFGMAADFQKQFGGKVFYYKVEGRLSTDLAKSIPGLDVMSVIVIRTTIDHILTGSEFFDTVEKNMRTFPESMHIFDSIGSTSGDLEMSNTMSDQQQGELAKLLAKFCRRNSTVIDITNSLFVALNHVRVGQTRGPAGGGVTSPGGKHWEHQIDTNIILSIAFPDGKILSKDGDKIGQNIKLLVKTTTMGPPEQTAILPLIYGKGIVKSIDVLNLAEQFSVIIKSGAWFNYGELKWQGRQNMYEEIEADSSLYDNIEKDVMSMLNGGNSEDV